MAATRWWQAAVYIAAIAVSGAALLTFSGFSAVSGTVSATAPAASMPNSPGTQARPRSRYFPTAFPWPFTSPRKAPSGGPGALVRLPAEMAADRPEDRERLVRLGCRRRRREQPLGHCVLVLECDAHVSPPKKSNSSCKEGFAKRDESERQPPSDGRRNPERGGDGNPDGSASAGADRAGRPEARLPEKVPPARADGRPGPVRPAQRQSSPRCERRDGRGVPGAPVCRPTARRKPPAGKPGFCLRLA